MRSLWPQLAPWIDAGETFALATVTAVSGSAPRTPGACMAIEPRQLRFLGSVSSGCLDAEVVEAARATLGDGKTRRLRFGPDGQPPWSDGLTCGGWIDVRLDPWWSCHPRSDVAAIGPVIRRWLADDEPGVLLSDGQHHCAIDGAGGASGDTRAFDDQIQAQALRHLHAEMPPVEWDLAGRIVFVRTIRRRPRLILIGAVDVAACLVGLARTAGFATMVVDPRRAYAVAERFAETPDRLVASWPAEMIAAMNPGRLDAAVALSHDPKVDDPALLALLGTECGYIGALGSARSHASRAKRLGEAGVADAALARIHGPAGIHLGTPDAAGIALGIMAGIVQWRAGKERELRDTTEEAALQDA